MPTGLVEADDRADGRRRARDHQRRCARSTPASSITTGGSKGGMTAIYHRRFYPGRRRRHACRTSRRSRSAHPTLRYAGVPRHARHRRVPPGRARRRDRDARAPPRRDADARAGPGDEQMSLPYTRIPIGPAVESAIVSLEWSFWQYYGVELCGQVPATTATDADAVELPRQDLAGVGDTDDERRAVRRVLLPGVLPARLSRRRRRVPRRRT